MNKHVGMLSSCRGELGEDAVDWVASGVPNAITADSEADKKARAEKRRQRERQRQKKRLRRSA